jgi:hypothetical protein
MADNNINAWDILSSLFETANEKITAAIAGAAIVSPAFPGLKETSDSAALWLPILGCVWLLSQIVLKWWHFVRPPESQE